MKKTFEEQTKTEIKYAVEAGKEFKIENMSDGTHFSSEAGYWVVDDEKTIKELFEIIKGVTTDEKVVIEYIEEYAAGKEIVIRNKKVLEAINGTIVKFETHCGLPYLLLNNGIWVRLEEVGNKIKVYQS